MGKLIVHHSISASSYAFLLATGWLGGCGMHGLLFEISICVLRLRSYVQRWDLNCYKTTFGVKLLWMSMAILYIPFRGFSSVLWFCILVPGHVKSEIDDTVNGGRLVVLHILGAVFTIMNSVVAYHYIPIYREDLRSALTATKVLPL